MTYHRLSLLAEMLAKAWAMWDGAILKERINKHQNRRRLIVWVHKAGTSLPSDFQPMSDANVQFVRAGKWTLEVEAEGHLNVR